MERRTFSRVGFALILMTAASYAVTPIVALFFALGIYDFNVLTLILQFFYYLVSIGLTKLVLIGIPRMPEQPKSRMRAGDLFCFVLMGIGVMYGGAYIGTYASELVALIVDGTAEPVLDELFSNLPVWILVLLTCVMAPIMEEILFRKQILDVLRPFGERRAAVMTGVLFGIFHMNLDQFFYAALLGFILSYVMLKTNNIVYPIIIHAVMNTIGGLIPLYLETASEEVQIAAGIAFIIVMLVGIGVFIKKGKTFIYAPAPYSFSRPITASVTWGNVGMILLLAVFAFKCIATLEPSWMPQWMLF